MFVHIHKCSLPELGYFTTVPLAYCFSIAYRGKTNWYLHWWVTMVSLIITVRECWMSVAEPASASASAFLLQLTNLLSVIYKHFWMLNQGYLINKFCDPSVICYSLERNCTLCWPFRPVLVLRPTAGPPPALCKNHISVDVEALIPPFVQGRHSIQIRCAGQHPDSLLNPSVISKESGNFHH